MEKQHGSKSKNNGNLLKKMLPRALSSVAFAQNAPSFSPGRDHHKQRQDHVKSGTNKVFFSGPIVSIVPVEARVRRSQLNDDGLVDEPTSPKVSCIGQIKMAKKNKCPRSADPPPSGSNVKTVPSRVKETQEQKASGHVSKIKRMFSLSSRSFKKTVTIAADDVTAPAPAPMLGQVRRFASGREAFSSFDWTAEIPSGKSEGRGHRDYHSDDEREHVYGEDEERKTRYSAPLVIDGGDRSGLKGKKEVNLWKRRTADALGPLQIKGS